MVMVMMTVTVMVAELKRLRKWERKNEKKRGSARVYLAFKHRFVMSQNSLFI